VRSALPATGASSDGDLRPQPWLSERQVLAIAEPVLSKKFPESFNADRPYHATYLDGVWHVRGTLPEDWRGGTPEAEIRDADGAIIRCGTVNRAYVGFVYPSGDFR
jgi:hypothetical protein